MKWIMAILIVLFVLMPAASAEENGTVYVLEYPSTLLEGWSARETVEREDVLLMLYCETNPADVLVRMAPIDTAQTPREYMEKCLIEQRTATLIRDAVTLMEWTAPWGALGMQMEYSYVYTSGEYVSSVYRRKMYVAPYAGELYMEFVVTVGDNNESRMIEWLENGFLRGEISLGKVRYTDKVYAYLEEAQFADGELILKLDTYIKEGGNEASEAKIYNNDPSLMQYMMAENAHIWIVSPNKTLGWEKTAPDAAKLSMHISDYVLTNEKFPPFVFYIDGNEIVWMEQMIEPT